MPVYVPTLLLAIGQGMLVPVLPLYAQSFGLSFTVVSLVVAATGIGTLMADVPAGALVGRVGRKPLMLLGAGAVAASTLLLFFARDPTQLIALRLVGGVGTALWNLSRMAYLTDAVPVKERGRALTSFGGISRIGTFGGPVVGGLIGAGFGLGAPLLASGGLAAVAAAISAVYITDAPTRPTTRSRVRWGIVAALIRQQPRELAAAGSAQVFASMIRSGRQLVVPLYGSSVLGLDVAAVGAIVSISSAIDMSLFIPAGIVTDRLGRKYASVPSFAVMALGMLILPLAADFTGLLIATSVIGLGNGLGAGSMMILGADLAPKEAVGEYLGVWRLVGDGGRAGGPVAVGTIADALDLTAAALVMAGVGLVAAVTLLLFVRETLATEAPSSPDAGAA